MNLSFPINQQFIDSGTKRRSGIAMSYVGFLVAHDTGDINSTAKNNADYYCRTANSEETSAHIFVDDTQAIEVIPTFDNPEKAWHVLYNVPLDNQIYGDDANDIAIGIELCFYDDTNRSQQAYLNYVELLAYLCINYNLNPATDIIGHEKLDPTRKVDPTSGLKYSGHTYSGLIDDVVAKYAAMRNPEPSVEDCTQDMFWRGIILDKAYWNWIGHNNVNIYWFLNKAYKYIIKNGGSIKGNLKIIDEAFAVLQKQGIISQIDTWQAEIYKNVNVKYLMTKIADYIN